jgi:hypothetical protein
MFSPSRVRADTETLQLRRGGQRVGQPFAGHEAIHRAFDKRERRDVLAQPHVLGAHKEGVAHYPIGFIVL